MYKFINLVLIISLIIASNSALADASNPVQAKATLRTPLQYIGWAVLKRNIIDPSAKEDDWISMRNISVTDDGKRIRLMDGEKETPYTIELIEITYEASNTTVLKLALYEEGNDRAFTYIWGEPGATRLGLNLRWIQAGFTKDNSINKSDG